MIESLEKGVNAFKANNKNTGTDVIDFVLVFLLLTFYIFSTFIYCLYRL